MGMNLASGLQGMLKDGHNSYEGVDDAIMRNINAAKELAAIVRTSLGPNGESYSSGNQETKKEREASLRVVWDFPSCCCCHERAQKGTNAPQGDRRRVSREAQRLFIAVGGVHALVR